MNKKGEQFNLQGLLIGIMMLGLFAGILVLFIETGGENYDTTGYDATRLSSYQATLTDTIVIVNQSAELIDKVSVNPTLFDFFAGIFNQVIAPFRFLYRAYTSVTGLGGDLSTDLMLPQIVIDFLWAMVVVLVMVGIVMTKNYMGRQK